MGRQRVLADLSRPEIGIHRQLENEKKKKMEVLEYENVARNGNNEKNCQREAVLISQYCSAC